MNKVEVYILSGFLGSGKTTLLQNLIKEEKERDRNVAVLMNEFGEFSVDSNLIGDQTPLKELLKGCICCTIKDDLEYQLLELYKENQPDVVFIEATGVAHPIEVFDACTSPIIATHLEVKSIVTVVDMNRWMNRDQLNNKLKGLLNEQVKHGDNIILNKADLISDKELQIVQNEVKYLNPSATIHITNHSDISITQLSDRDITFYNNREQMNAKEHLRIQSMTYKFTNPIDQKEFEKWLSNISKSIFRIKGFVRLAGDQSNVYIFQYAYGEPYFIPEPIQFPTNIVFIGDSLDKETINNELKELENMK